MNEANNTIKSNNNTYLNKCKFCGNNLSNNDNYCPSCGNKTYFNKQTHLCLNCNSEIESDKIYCDNCIKLKNIEKNKKISITATIVFILLYLFFYIVFGWISELGTALSGGMSKELPFIVEISRTLFPCFIFSIIPFCISLTYSKLAKQNILFILNIIILIVHIFFMFM